MEIRRTKIIWRTRNSQAGIIHFKIIWPSFKFHQVKDNVLSTLKTQIALKHEIENAVNAEKR